MCSEAAARLDTSATWSDVDSIACRAFHRRLRPQASAIAIIGGADGPTAIFLASKLAPELLGTIAVAAYSYMALVPLIQPPIMKAFTTAEERKIQMAQLRPVTKTEKIIFPLAVLLLTI